MKVHGCVGGGAPPRGGGGGGGGRDTYSLTLRHTSSSTGSFYLLPCVAEDGDKVEQKYKEAKASTSNLIKDRLNITREHKAYLPSLKKQR